MSAVIPPKRPPELQPKRESEPLPMPERILQAADRLFYGTGIQAIGVDAIAAGAGISKRTLYNHFASKDDLITAYLQRRTQRTLMPPTDVPGEPRALILGVFDALARVFASKHFRGCPFVNAVSELSGNADHPALAVAREVKAKRRRWLEAQCRALQVADARALAEQLVILAEGAIAVSLVRGGDPHVAHQARAAAVALLDAASAIPAKNKRPLSTGRSPSVRRKASHADT